jgi:hypothetical protein
MAKLGRSLQQGVEIGNLAALPLECGGNLLRQLWRAIHPHPKAQTPQGGVAQIDLAPGRFEATPNAAVPPRLAASRPSVNSMCLQVPRPLVAKSGQAQKLSSSPAPRIATR